MVPHPSGCNRYFTRFSLKAGGLKTTSNIPVECPQCKNAVWKFAMAMHWEKHHADVGVMPSEFEISAEERKKLNAKKLD